MLSLYTGFGVVIAALLALVLVQRRSLASCRKKLSSRLSLGELQGEKLRAIFTGIADGIMVLDADYKLQDWNHHFPEFVGVPADLLRVGMGIEEILRAQAIAGEFGPVDIDAEVARRTAIIKTAATVGTVERHRPNGRTIELRRSLMPGRGLVTLYTDITARRDAERQLRQAQKMEAIGQLTGGIAHDFNNLLMIILGNIQLGRTCLEAENVVRAVHHLDTASNGANRAATLVARLLAFARQQPLQPQEVDVNHVVTGMADLLRHSLGSGIGLETVLAGGLWRATIDPHQLENALLNLAINARDAMGADGKLTIETANTRLDAAYAAEHTEVTPGQFVMVAVSDNGTGMTEEEISRAFEPFFTTKEVGRGSGLGLSQVFGFIKQSGGHVKIYSELGAGTSVKLYLPRSADASTELVEHVDFGADIPRARQGESVLVVEDDADVLEFSVEALESLGFQVVGAPDAAAALEVVAGRPELSLLFTDIELPGLNGQDLAKHASDLRPELPVLFTTGYATNAVVHQGMLRPEIECLNKPFTLAELANRVRSTIDGASVKDGAR